MQSVALDLSTVQNDSRILERKMLDLLKESKMFLETILHYLKGKRLTKSNFSIESRDSIPSIVDSIKNIVDKEFDCQQIDSIIKQLKPKRNFLFDTLQKYVTNTQSIQNKAEAERLYNEYLEKVVWKLCASEYNLAKKSASRIARNIRNVSLEDKVSYAYIGLVKAAHKFDLNRGVKFSTYATWWIWESILNGCNNDMYFLKVETPMRQKYIKFLSSMQRGKDKEKGKEESHLTDYELSNIYSSCNISSIYNEDGSEVTHFDISRMNSDVFYLTNPEVVLGISDQILQLQEIINTKLTMIERSLLLGYYGVFDYRKRSVKQLCRDKKLTEEQFYVILNEIRYKLRSYLTDKTL